jgi:hypothetical protein
MHAPVIGMLMLAARLASIAWRAIEADLGTLWGHSWQVRSQVR